MKGDDDILPVALGDSAAGLRLDRALAEALPSLSRERVKTLIKGGRVTGTRSIAKTAQAELIRLMVGRDVVFQREADGTPGDVVLEVRAAASLPFVRAASFTVRRGEIVCLAGLVGSGRSETCEMVFGTRALHGGEIILKGSPIRFSGPWDAMRAGIGMVPEDRKEAGLFLSKSIAENIAVTVLPRLSPGGVMSEAAVAELANRYVRELKIATPGIRQSVGNLSGGNQQKVLLASSIAAKPRYLVLHEPTRGVDVGARVEIHRLLAGVADGGCATLMVTSDVEEAVTVPDRLIVIRDGRIAGELSGNAMTQANAISLATED